MWSGSGNWGQYPIQQSAYANIPTEEVDWASVAKQWIAQREVMSSTTSHDNTPPLHYASSAAPPPPPPPPPAASDHHEQQLTSSANQPDPVVGGSDMHLHRSVNVISDNCNSQDSADPEMISHVAAVHGQGWDQWSNTGWSMPNWAVPPPPPPDQNAIQNNLSDGQFRVPDPFMPGYKYDQHVNDFYEQPFNSNAVAGGFPYWPVPGDQQSMQIPHLMPQSSACEYRPPPRRGFAGQTTNVPSLLDETLLDAAKRRHLPAWIREGLEKMEREKMKQMEKEKIMQEEKNDVNNGSKKLEDGIAVKSRFDSDNEDNSDSEVDSDKMECASEQEKPTMDSPKKVEEVELLSEEEKQVQIMVRVRQMLTEVLLDVTNREVEDIASFVYKSAKAKQAKAPVKQLAKSSALASITSLGLGYDTDSDNDDDSSRHSNASPDAEEEVSESSDDDAIQRCIVQKKAEFERKMRQLEDYEQEKNSLRANAQRQQKLDTAMIKQEVVPDVVTAMTKSEVVVEKPSLVDGKNRKSIDSVDTDTHSEAVVDSNHKSKRRTTCDTDNEMKQSNKELSSYKVKRESRDSSENSSNCESSRKISPSGYKDANRECVQIKTTRDRHKDEKRSHSKRKSRDRDKKSETVKQRYEEKHELESYERHEDRLREKVVSRSSDSHSKRHRSSHSQNRHASRDKDSKKRKHHDSRKRKKARDSEQDELFEKDSDSELKHDKRYRSCSSSNSSGYHHKKSHRRDRESFDRRKRQRSSSRCRGSHGKTSRANRKSRSPSRSSDD